MKRTIRQAKEDDLPRILELIECGRQKMRAVDNMEQWTDGNPRPAVLLQDIQLGNSYLVEDDGLPVATFAFVEGPDVTYAHIYEGQWLDEQSEGDSSDEMGNYCVIHRLAIMRNALLKYGFSYCGIIYLLDGAERLAYQRRIVD